MRTHYVYKFDDGTYVGTKHYHSHVATIDEAKVFQSKGAATSVGRLAAEGVELIEGTYVRVVKLGKAIPVTVTEVV